jgi:membrane-bound ClpP family serine protease
MKGMTGVVTETVTPKGGKIRVGVELWDARCEVGEIARGSEVRILSMQNLTLNVASINT